jgi:hypothetical protein
MRDKTWHTITRDLEADLKAAAYFNTLSGNNNQ